MPQTRRPSGASGGRGGQFAAHSRANDPQVEVALADPPHKDDTELGWTILDEVRLVADPVGAINELGQVHTAAVEKRVGLERNHASDEASNSSELLQATEVAERSMLAHAAMVGRALHVSAEVQNNPCAMFRHPHGSVWAVDAACWQLRTTLAQVRQEGVESYRRAVASTLPHNRPAAATATREQQIAFDSDCHAVTTAALEVQERLEERHNLTLIVTVSKTDLDDESWEMPVVAWLESRTNALIGNLKNQHHDFGDIIKQLQDGVTQMRTSTDLALRALRHTRKEYWKAWWETPGLGRPAHAPEAERPH